MSRSSRRIFARLSLASCLAVALGLASATGASAKATLGQVAPGDPGQTCTDTNLEQLQPTVTTGNNAYVVPPNGVTITDWGTRATSGAGQQLKLKVFRKVAEPATYKVVAHDGPRTLASGLLNNFAVNLPVQPGDLVGLTSVNGGSVPNGCVFDSPGNTVLAPDSFGDLMDGESLPFTPDAPNSSLNLVALVAVKASNDFEISKVKKNKSKGTAILTVDVPGPGELSLSGAGIKPQRATRATISKNVTTSKVTLKVKAKGAKKAKLQNRGKVKVKAKVTFTPSKGSADLPGDPNTEPKKIKLVDN